MILRCTVLIGLLLGVSLAVAGQDSGIAQKVALVIGIRDYQTVPPLRNSVNDARDMAGALKAKGFTVIELYDAKTKRELQDGIRKYYNLLSGHSQSVGLLFYSGHGMQVDGINYLIPTTADMQIKADVDDQCLNMDYIMQALEQASNSLNIFIIDACRNNPFRSFSRSAEKGLSMVNAPEGSYIVYSTKPGSVASDGTGRNGLFTSKLLKHLNTPNLEIEQVFKRVAADVSAESNDSQRPWIASDYTGNFFFTPGHDKAEPITKTVEKNNDVSAPRDYPAEIAAYKKSAALGDADAMYQLGQHYYDGIGTAKDYSEAITWYKKSADKGYSKGEAMYGWMLSTGKGTAADPGKAFTWLSKAAVQGWAAAQNNLGFCYESGEGVTRNYAVAAEWYRKAADQDHTTAQGNLGNLYLNGWGVTKDDGEAKKWLRKAAEKNDIWSQTKLGWLYSYGDVKDYSEAFYWVEKAANQGSAEAQVNFGLLYQNGWGTTADDTAAAQWFRKAADQGEAFGQNNIAWMYCYGKGVPKNYAESVHYYKLSVEQGNAMAMVNLGFMYEKGWGVDLDLAKAKELYKKSADKGNAGGKEALARLQR